VRISAEDYLALTPDLVLVMLCGFGIERAGKELAATPLPDLGAPIGFVDGNAYTSRPGPRIVEGAGKIQEALNTVG
jgi:hypothetical protein